MTCPIAVPSPRHEKVNLQNEKMYVDSSDLATNCLEAPVATRWKPTQHYFQVAKNLVVRFFPAGDTPIVAHLSPAWFDFQKFPLSLLLVVGPRATNAVP